MHARALRNLASINVTVALALVLASSLGACAGVKSSNNSSGSGGTGGIIPPPLPGLVSLRIEPASVSINLERDPITGRITPGVADYVAYGTMDSGATEDVSARVQWPSDVMSLRILGGHVTVTAPGRYTIRAKSGSIEANAELIANFTGSFTAPGYNPDATPSLDGAASGAAQIAYPLDGALFPSNMGPIYVHITKPTAATSARLKFQAEAVDINWYGPCEAADATGMPWPGTGCYVRLPLEFTQLFIAASERGDIRLTARVGGSGPPAESAAINVAWSNVSLTGGLYYWTTIQPGPIFPGYRLPPMATSGTGIQRYNFDKEMPAPELVYTDMGPPPAFAGSPWARATDGGQGTCVGCHSITNDGKFMALSINGSDAAGFSILDITNKTLTPVSPVNAGQPLQRFVRESCAGNPALGCGAETTFGPTDPTGAMPAMINMYRSKLYLRAADMTLNTQSEVVPSAADQYRTDPFWSQDGKFFAFTGFATPSVGLYNTSGLNGDQKIGGSIWVATAEARAVHDDAVRIVPGEAGRTNFYPAISNDSKLLVYNQSTCGGLDPNRGPNEYGNGSCDGYDDWTATLFLTKPTGGAPIRLDRANGQFSASNSWPRWSPDFGNFRGRRLYWIAFSSRRNYGLQVNTAYQQAPITAKPQLWFTGILTGDEVPGDPSFAPVWLPNQNPVQMTPNGNHVPMWVAVAVPIPQ